MGIPLIKIGLCMEMVVNPLLTGHSDCALLDRALLTFDQWLQLVLFNQVLGKGTGGFKYLSKHGSSSPSTSWQCFTWSAI